MSINVGALSFPKLRGNLAFIRYPALAEVKLDGECEFVVVEGGIARLVNKYSTQRTALPVLTELAGTLANQGVMNAIMLAELYYGIGKRGALYDLLRNKHSDNLRLLVFDILIVNGRDIAQIPLLERKDILLDLLPKEFTGRPQVVTSHEDAMAFFRDATDQGFEGIVVKSLNEPFTCGASPWVKLKFKDASVFPVSLISPDQDRIEILVETPGRRIAVGVKVADKIKRTLRLGDTVEVEHQGILPSGSLRHPSFKNKIETKGNQYVNSHAYP